MQMQEENKSFEQPIFVRVDEYQDVIDLLALVRDRITKAGALLQNIQKVEEEVELELQQWSRSLVDIERRTTEIDRTLFRPGRLE